MTQRVVIQMTKVISELYLWADHSKMLVFIKVLQIVFWRWMKYMFVSHRR